MSRFTKRELYEIEEKVRRLNVRDAKVNFDVNDLIQMHSLPDYECWPEFAFMLNKGDKFLILEYLSGNGDPLTRQYKVFDLQRKQKHWFDKGMVDQCFKKLKT